MTNKGKYRELCKKERDIPIFSKDWWLDAVCGEDNWSVVLIENDGEIIASLPYFKKKKYGFVIITMPPLTQNFKLWIKYPANQKYNKKLYFENKIISELIDKLPKFDMFNLYFHYSLTNWLPFYWKNFKQTTRYTYIIEDLKNIESVFSNFSRSKKREIKRAEKVVSITDNFTLEDCYKTNELTFQRQNLKIPFSFKLLKDIDIVCKENNCRKLIFAADKENNIHTTLYYIYDDISVMCLIGGSDPKLRDSSANSLIHFEAMKFAHKNDLIYNFEGSMMQGVENFFRGFGAIQKPYFSITKINSKALQLLNLFVENSVFIKNIVKKIIN